MGLTYMQVARFVLSYELIIIIQSNIYCSVVYFSMFWFIANPKYERSAYNTVEWYYCCCVFNVGQD